MQKWDVSEEVLRQEADLEDRYPVGTGSLAGIIRELDLAAGLLREDAAATPKPKRRSRPKPKAFAAGS
mgnify:CR=1 FL=1